LFYVDTGHSVYAKRRAFRRRLRVSVAWESLISRDNPFQAASSQVNKRSFNRFSEGMDHRIQDVAEKNSPQRKLQFLRNALKHFLRLTKIVYTLMVHIL